MRKSILAVVSSVLLFPLLGSANEFQTDNVSNLIAEVIELTNNIPGWCTKEKRKALVEHIVTTKPAVCVEIGVYGGKSLIPIAESLKFIGNGVVYGIDPWKIDECTKHYSEDHIVTQIWKKQNMERLYSNLLKVISKNSLENHCFILRTTSCEASKGLGKIDFLHIDGNHSEESTIEDVKLYFPKVRKGGYICLDDCLRGTTQKAYSKIISKCQVVKSIDNGNSLILKK